MNKDRPTAKEFFKAQYPEIYQDIEWGSPDVLDSISALMEEYAIQQDAINKARIIEILKEKLSNRGWYQDHLISDQKLLDEIATAIQQESEVQERYDEAFDFLGGKGFQAYYPVLWETVDKALHIAAGLPLKPTE